MAASVSRQTEGRPVFTDKSLYTYRSSGQLKRGRLVKVVLLGQGGLFNKLVSYN